ncbi:MAG: AAA family ATPase [Bacteroides sp.]|nr:AAA family ATPase [Bacteroides sp.]
MFDELEKEWAEYPVFHIDFNGEDYTRFGKLEEKIVGAIETWEAEYGRDPYKQALGDRFIYVLAQAARKYGRRSVVLIDEYDKPLLDEKKQKGA